MKDEANDILEYTKEHYNLENKLIERSMINYYQLRLQKDKTEKETLHQNKIFEGVLDLFLILSDQLENEMGIDKNIVFEHLKEIHIKT